MKLCRIANAVHSSRAQSASFRYMVTCAIHEPIGPDNPIEIEDLETEQLITVRMLEDRMGEDLLKRFFYKQAVRSA